MVRMGCRSKNAGGLSGNLKENGRKNTERRKSRRTNEEE